MKNDKDIKWNMPLREIYSNEIFKALIPEIDELIHTSAEHKALSGLIVAHKVTLDTIFDALPISMQIKILAEYVYSPIETKRITWGTL